ncbi:hypothetical protein BFP70_04400 [Thioclava sp. SK-1]|nr:hypothetical protein BFP70_04400 [Thioclava sp. SK-1]
MSAQIWHGRHGARLSSSGHNFTYRAQFVSLSVEEIDAGASPIPVDRLGLWRLRKRDYGPQDGTSLRVWADEMLQGQYDLSLVTLPRSAIYGFNPVSFWLAQDGPGKLRAVIAEVSSTFGERHCYIIRHANGQDIAPTDRLMGEKMFHVSPFLPRNGRYSFRFDIQNNRFGAFIDWSNGATSLGTSLTGKATALTQKTLRKTALRHPFQPEKAMALIHWQAAKLAARRMPFHRQPAQLTPHTTPAERHGHD